jgi:NAD(P)H-hydrate epimerase
VITPHLGEMSRLTGKTVGEIQKNLLQTAADFADENQVICVLKDEHTVTALPDHKRYLNLSPCNQEIARGMNYISFHRII